MQTVLAHHRWPKRDEWNVVSRYDSRDGNEHHIRQCLLCNIVKITIIPPNAFESWHEWVTNSGTAWIGDATPPCIAKGIVEAAPPHEAHAS